MQRYQKQVNEKLPRYFRTELTQCNNKLCKRYTLVFGMSVFRLYATFVVRRRRPVDPTTTEKRRFNDNKPILLKCRSGAETADS